MINIFTKYKSTTTAISASKVTDSAATWKANQYSGWFAYFPSQNKSYKIDSNTVTELLFSNTLIDTTVDYEIAFVDRSRLVEIESDAANTDLMDDDFLDKKYNLANVDISAKVFNYLRSQYKNNFDPALNILNLTSLQQVFCYYLLAKAYQDLTISPESFESFKGYNMFEKSYNDSIRDSLSFLQLDINQNGVVDTSEIISNNGGMRFLFR